MIEKFRKKKGVSSAELERIRKQPGDRWSNAIALLENEYKDFIKQTYSEISIEDVSIGDSIWNWKLLEDNYNKRILTHLKYANQLALFL